MVTYANISPKMVNPRGIAGKAEREEDPQLSQEKAETNRKT